MLGSCHFSLPINCISNIVDSTVYTIRHDDYAVFPGDWSHNPKIGLTERAKVFDVLTIWTLNIDMDLRERTTIYGSFDPFKLVKVDRNITTAVFVPTIILLSRFRYS